jgi:hypothetical protein
MVDITIDSSRDLDELMRRIGLLGDVSRGQQEVAVRNTMGDFVGEATDYPPETEANRPRVYPPYYYERGYGLIYNSGMRLPTSEQLNESWSAKIRIVGADTVEGTASTDATYAPYVQSQQFQAWFHAARDWRTVETILDEMGLPSDAQVTVSAFGESRSYFIDAANRIARFIEGT